jgi:hypothetical protein
MIFHFAAHFSPFGVNGIHVGIVVKELLLPNFGDSTGAQPIALTH